MNETERDNLAEKAALAAAKAATAAAEAATKAAAAAALLDEKLTSLKAMFSLHQDNDSVSFAGLNIKADKVNENVIVLMLSDASEKGKDKAHARVAGIVAFLVSTGIALAGYFLGQ